MRYRSFSFPKDITILVHVLYSALACRLRVKKYGYSRLLEDLEGSRGSKAADGEFMTRLNKYYKASNFFLLRVIRDPNPCMIRSLILYGLCLKYDIRASLKTGVYKCGGRLSGHSWLEIGGEPLNEDRKFLERFTVLHEI